MGGLRTPRKRLKLLIKNEIKFMENEDIPCFEPPFFGTILSWKMPTGYRDVPSPETRIFYKVNGYATRKVHR